MTRTQPNCLKLSGLICCLFAVLSLSNRAHAIQTVFTYDGSQIAAARAGGPFTVGNLIQVGSTDVLINYLGAQDADAAVDSQDTDGADGLTGFADDDGFFIDTFGSGGAIQVGLWTSDGSTLLGSASVTSNDPVIGSWRYAAIDQGVITLEANTQYLLGAFVGGGIEWFLDGASTNTTPFSATADFSIVETRFRSGSFGSPTTAGGGQLGRWAPANAAFIIPEPTTATLGLMALAGLLVRRRRAA